MLSPSAPPGGPLSSSMARTRIARSQLVVRARLDQLGRVLGQKAGKRVRKAGRMAAGLALIVGVGLLVLSSLVARAFARARRS